MILKNYIKEKITKMTNIDDKYNGKQIIHFGEKGESLRLHGVRGGEYFVLLRIDPNHDFNNKKK